MKVFISQIARMISRIDSGDLTLSEKYCPYCGSVSRTSDEFCNSCGASIQETAEPAQNQPIAPPAPQQQTAITPPPTHQYGANTQTIYHDPTKQSTAQTNNTFGILALFLSIGGFIAVGFLPFVSVPMFFIALILGIVGLKKTTQKGFPIAGIVISSIGIILSIILVIIFILALIYSQ
ncbi:MAG: zinc ribbon domain-containing protein [Candidatus Heimdallarchaeota archaeon]